MAMVPLFLSTTYLLMVAPCFGSIPSKWIKIHDLDALSSETDHHNIFTPLISNLDGFSHDVFVEDAFGKFMKLKYKATHPADSAFIKLDGMKSDIESIECLEDDTNTIELEMTNSAAANSMFQSVTEHLSLFPSDHFITGSYEWLCRDKNTQRFSPLMRRITSIHIDDPSTNTLIFTTERASYSDLFDTLDLEFVSNAKLYHSENATADIPPVPSRRRLESDESVEWWTDIWDDICSGMSGVIDHVNTWMNDLGQKVSENWYYGVEDAIEVVEGKTVSRNGTDDYFWSYNYNKASKKAVKPYYLDQGKHVECSNCYVWFDLNYTFKLRIEDREMKYLYAVAEGNAEINAEILLKVYAYILMHYFTQNSCIKLLVIVFRLNQNRNVCCSSSLIQF